ncbi:MULTISPECIES: methylated-DNA--[protein]-cysteine S-methyltransferase [unclassified Enterococcus]|uniref:methylated-DNA--[protein]-cysteine S-methyltransferase n=1 Tax=unclassified Enterococcus TaxID=2608891 RepID=UPI00155527BF|nr:MULTISPECIES: methylated-DNA--[protein]-cysteine S-methyltransferase [unclassified Enterococcus]MBS7577108.1 methylated-DNA--[protein]-cysteine S-methyltransferase [Enterococcus sp. MMGLQ5-2]MBS7584445.1 methylated-DNA--[protein]-cysteine S-methyltransferase [Enterococcus sp. MMGLQ5-1]NPD12300.1 methylated-DNA--[protein]-cysteine S-methyltransferase [Enterococcus sp. MMGLQ5-1]NPD36942.1 methylated-DNA--[protein]-cysteine S-methyltransferase [Enterococcus sp. MMGLQ5-2]
MLFRSMYISPLGNIEILCDEMNIKGVWFENQKYYGAKYKLTDIRNEENRIIKMVKDWLEEYFSGGQPLIDKTILAPEVTEFQSQVLELLEEIPYGQTRTYKSIADSIAKNGKRSSARAVGGAVGHNPISILIPCHRVVAVNGSLTGYAGGINRKIELLAIEGFDRERLENHQI